MKIYKKYLFIIGLAALASCKKEAGAPEASTPIKDPYVRVDNAASDIDHQIYLVYQQSQIPVLYTDTLSKNPVNILNLNYQLSGPQSNFIYTYPKAKTAILAGINFVKNSILPPLGPKIKVYSISLLDDIKTVLVYSPTYSVTTNYSVLNGISTFGIANVSSISSMTTAQLKSYRAEILTNLLLNPLNTSGALAGFYALSKSYYGKYVYGAVTDTNYLEYKDKKEYGFIPNGTESTVFYALGDQNSDLKDYLAKILTISDTDFKSQYGAYPLVMSKYNLLIAALTAQGFDLTKI